MTSSDFEFHAPGALCGIVRFVFAANCKVVATTSISHHVVRPALLCNMAVMIWTRAYFLKYTHKYHHSVDKY